MEREIENLSRCISMVGQLQCRFVVRTAVNLLTGTRGGDTGETLWRLQ